MFPFALTAVWIFSVASEEIRSGMNRWASVLQMSTEE